MTRLHEFTGEFHALRIKILRIIVIYILSMCMLACQTQERNTLDCPSIIYDNLRMSRIKKWERIYSDTDNFIAVAKTLYVENGLWESDFDHAAKSGKLRTFVFKGESYYAVYWLYTEQNGNETATHFLAICYQERTRNVLFCGPGTVMNVGNSSCQ